MIRSSNSKKTICQFAAFLTALLCLCFSFSVNCGEPTRHRVIVSTDIGGTDPDDFQSMVHLLLYADTLDLEGLISSPFGPGRKKHILDVIDIYQKDYKNLLSHSQAYPSPESLRKISKQGEVEVAPYSGYRQATEGSNWIISRAKVKDSRPLNILVWGGIEDLAQALHDAPEILPKLRVYWIGGPNKKWSPDAYQYIVEHHPKLWIIESNATYRGWFVGGVQDQHWGNSSFVKKHIAGQGALGNFFNSQLGGEIKMGDTPSVAWLLNGNPYQPPEENWGGQYTRAWTRPYRVFNRLTNKNDQIEEFSIFELSLPLAKKAPDHTFAYMLIGNQYLVGHVSAGKVHFRFSPKKAMTFDYTIESNDKSIHLKTGAITAVATGAKQKADKKWPNWWVDNPSPAFRDGEHIGTKTVSRWRKAYLADFASRISRTTHANSSEEKAGNQKKISK